MTQSKYLVVALAVIVFGSANVVAQTASSQPSSAPIKISTESAVLPSASAAPAPSAGKSARTQSSAQSGKLASEESSVSLKQARATAKNSAAPTTKTTTVKSSK